MYNLRTGEVPERSIGLVLKTNVDVSSPGVRIPPSPLIVVDKMGGELNNMRYVGEDLCVGAGGVFGN